MNSQRVATIDCNYTSSSSTTNPMTLVSLMRDAARQRHHDRQGNCTSTAGGVWHSRQEQSSLVAEDDILSSSSFSEEADDDLLLEPQTLLMRPLRGVIPNERSLSLSEILSLVDDLSNDFFSDLDDDSDCAVLETKHSPDRTPEGGSGHREAKQ